MKKLVVVLLIAALLLGPAPVWAGAAADAALALGAFAVFNQLWTAAFWPSWYWRGAYPYYYYYPYHYPPYYYTPPPATYVPPPSVQREVVYPHGRYVLRGDGVTEAYQWVWVPNPPPPPPPPSPERQ